MFVPWSEPIDVVLVLDGSTERDSKSAMGLRLLVFLHKLLVLNILFMFMLI